MIDRRIKPLTKEQQDRLLHTLPVWARSRIKAAEAEVATLQIKKESMQHHIKALQMLCKAQHQPTDMNEFCREVEAIDNVINVQV